MPKEREDKQFKSSSGICNIHAVIWYPDSDVYKKPVGVIQIAHGMIDHIERFEEMAEYFTGKGFVVAGTDQLIVMKIWDILPRVIMVQTF